MRQRFYDKLGIISSLLCLVHCLVVPIGMLLALEIHWLHEWWGWTFVQLGFIAIAAWAVYHTGKHSAHKWVKGLLWTSVFALLLALFLPHHVEETVNYLAAAGLIVGHGLNLWMGTQRSQFV